jgi:hypothetical protein
MGLNVLWQDERGEIIERGPTWTSPWKYVEGEAELRDTCCLRFIDSYGDTTFNQVQIPILIDELIALLPKSKDFQARENLESLINFIRKAEEQVHTYIKFVGSG